MKDPGIRKLYLSLVNALSFSSELYKLRRELNARIDAAGSSAPDAPNQSLGVSKWFRNRRITIAEAYLMVVRELESTHSKNRLRALRMMVDVSFHAKTLDMPLNTARVQMALIKEAVKNRNNRRKQLELLHDFSIASHGQPQFIRKLLDELNIIELPETGARIKNLDAGWDEHVHDTATSGRKNPTQLLIDAFIKGISELTIAYSSAASVTMMGEAIDAGRIVGIRVNIGLEFSVLVSGRRFHFMAVLPQFKSGKDAAHWFRQHSSSMRTILDGLEKNQENRVDAVKKLLQYFNETALKEINAGYPEDPMYTVPKLKMKELLATVPVTAVNRLHLGEFLYNRYKPVLFNRMMRLKVQYERARRDARRKLKSDWELRIIEDRYQNLRTEYRTLYADGLQKKYFTNPDIGDYQTVFSDMPKLKAILAKAGCALKVLHPLEYGYEMASRLLEHNRGVIDRVEIYNMQDSIRRDPEQLLKLARLVNEMNADSERKGLAPYIPVSGSDSTGRSRTVPGMGFVRADMVRGTYRRKYIKRHIALPALVSAMIEAKGKPVDADAIATAPVIISMGKITDSAIAEKRIPRGEENETALVPPSKVWRYLNPVLVNLVFATTGFLVAERFIGPYYAFLWMFITSFRNSIADLVAGRGTRLSGWNLKSVNFGNVARSLFWTGFSVPILGFVKSKFDALWPGPVDGALFNTVKFFFISFTNGLYLATHNTLRGFDRKVVRANFFRSVIAWPFATVFAPFGNALGVPSIVQAKIWSDFVAGFIEGSSKYRKIIALRRRDLEEIIPQIMSNEPEERYSSILDLLFLYREEPRTASSLKKSLIAGSGSTITLKVDKETRACTFEELYENIMDERLDHALIDFVLSRFQQETSVELIELVASVLPEMRDWMASNAPQKVHASPVLALESADTVDQVNESYINL
jgi:hypothetical protein